MNLSAHASGLRSLVLVQQFMNAPSLSGAFRCGCRGWVYPTESIGGPQPPICFLREPAARLDSFKYSARICRMAMRFVRGRFEKHLRVPFLHTL